MGLWRSISNRAVLLGIRYGWIIPESVRNWIGRRLYPPGSAKPMALFIDVIGSCNLRCPSCPVGNTGPLNESGLMPKETFQRIIDKAYDEFGIRSVSLFNWTEPLLHPQLAEFVRMVKGKGMYCMLSSNLNVMKNIDEVLKAGPDWFRISLSGFTQEVYGRTHKAGQIERVKENMRLLAEAKKRVGAKRTMIKVYYHKYRNNLHEVEPMRQFSEQLGFHWEESWAYYGPLEKVFDYVDGTLPAEERRWIDDELALPLGECIKAARKVEGISRCTLLEDQLVVNVKGELALCCGLYDMNDVNHRLGKFLDMTPADIKAKKTDHPTCERCAKDNLYLHGNYHEVPELVHEYDRLVTENLQRKPGAPGPVSLPLVS